MRTICLLGGTGFVGSRIAARLVADGHRVNIPTRNRERHRSLLVLPSATITTADIHNPDVLREQFDDCDTVINLVGILNEKGNKGLGFEHAHRELPAKVVDACQATGVDRLVHMSALKANAENGPSHYLRTKGEAENLIKDNCGSELHWTIFQPSVIFGPSDQFFNRFAQLLKLTPVLPLACPNSRFQPIYVGNVVEAFVGCLDNPDTFGQTYQLGGPKIYSLKEIVAYVAKLLKLKRLVIELPDSLSRLQARIMDFVPGKPFSMDNYRSLRVNNICDENGLEALGITPQSVENIVPRYLTKQEVRRRLDSYRRSAGR